MRKLYKFSEYFGRHGSINGIFVEEESRVKKAIGREVYFGEALGKHSEVTFKLADKHFKVISDDQPFIFQFEKLGCQSGHNPFEYSPFADEEFDEEDEQE